MFKLIRLYVSVLSISIIAITSQTVKASTIKREQRPNILIISSEDNSPIFNCYGDNYAVTPNFDRLASEGVLYRNAFANAPVCSPARNTLITGMYAVSLGNQGMRSRYPTPSFIKFYPSYLKELGYYCTNNSKEDYNTTDQPEAWSESSGTAHYSNREEGQPFFHIRNLTISHESALHRPLPEEMKLHDPNEVTLPPYHPDTPEIRADWAKYYDIVTELDRQVGKILEQLESDGLAENTIVIYFGDHGGVLARSKRYLFDSGTRVPMIIRVPEKYRDLSPWKRGESVDQLVSFIDIAPTVLNIAGIEIPKYMQGRPIIGKSIDTTTEYVHLYRGRMDERFDMVRGVRSKKFKYIKNYMPYRVYGQHIDYLWRAPSARSWERTYLEGKCNKVQSRFWETKELEELYDIESDPWEVNNLASDPDYRETLIKMRNENIRWSKEIYDTGFIPEGERARLIKNSNLPMYDIIRGMDIDKIIESAEIATSPDVKISELKEMLESSNSSIRYWGAVGALIAEKRAKPLKESLIKLLNDPSPSIRVASAEILFKLGENYIAERTLLDIVSSDVDQIERCFALNSIEALGLDSKPSIQALLKEQFSGRINSANFKSGYDIRMASWLINKNK